MATDMLPRGAADSTPQHLIALRSANRVRLHRAVLKSAIADGRLAVSDLPDDADAGGMRVFEALRAQHRWGPQRVQKAMRDAGIAETTTIGRLTERQRGALRAIGA